MSTHRSLPGEIIDVRPLGAAIAGSKTAALFKTEGLEVIRLVLPKGKELPSHAAPGPITVHCLEGRISFTTPSSSCELAAGELLYLTANEQHALVAIEDSSALVTLVLPR